MAAGSELPLGYFRTNTPRTDDVLQDVCEDDEVKAARAETIASEHVLNYAEDRLVAVLLRRLGLSRIQLDAPDTGSACGVWMSCGSTLSASNVEHGAPIPSEKRSSIGRLLG